MSDPRADLLAALPDLIAARIKVTLPELKTCKGQAGRFDLEALKKKSIAAPAVLISNLGFAQGEAFAGPSCSFLLEMAAYVITKDTLTLPRDQRPPRSATLARLIPERIWGERDLGPAGDLRGIPLLTAASDQAVSLWAITWRQPITLTGAPLTEPQPINPLCRPVSADRRGACGEL